MTVILVTQETGARGDEVAAGIAACLGFELIHVEGVEQGVAGRMQVSTSVFHRLLEGNASLLAPLMIGPRPLMWCMAAELIKLGARSNVVVRCRGTSGLLRPAKHVICVHACATVEPQLPAPAGHARGAAPYWRFRRSVATLRRWLFARHREGLQSCNLVLNTAQMPVDECVDRVRRLLQSPQLQRLTASHAKTMDHGQETCNRVFPASGAAPNLEVDVCGDTIRLSPAISSEEAIARVEEHLGGNRDHAGLAAHASSPAIQPGLFHTSIATVPR